MTTSKRKKVLFVCMGNICRSPAAETVFRDYLEQDAPDSEIEVDSAGTISYHVGEAPDNRMTQAAAERGYSLTGVSRQIQAADLDVYDLIVPMDKENLRDIQKLANGKNSKAKIQLLCDFIPSCNYASVPDPYYGGPQGFHVVLDLLEQACAPILEHLQGTASVTSS